MFFNWKASFEQLALLRQIGLLSNMILHELILLQKLDKRWAPRASSASLYTSPIGGRRKRLRPRFWGGEVSIATAADKNKIKVLL